MRKLFIAIACSLIIPIYLKAQTRSQEAGLQIENDSFLAQGSDRYYTNGVFIYYRHALKVTDGSQLANKILGFEAGQKMYNPQSGYIPSTYYIDRPFACYLYVGSTLNLLYQNEGNLKLGVQAGVIGPAAYGRQTQEFIHRTFGFYPPQGWEHQIRDMAVLNFSCEYNKLLLRSSAVDLSFSSYANLGNAFIGAGIGPMLRIGRFNPLFNSVATQSSVSKHQKIKGHELFFYYKPMFNVIARDATVQGPGSPDPTNEEIALTPNHIMFSNQLGGMYNSGNRWTLDVGVIFHTKDVPNMVRVHQWGSITLMYHFK